MASRAGVAGECASMRDSMPDEIGGGFGIFQSKPASRVSPAAVTPVELGGARGDGPLDLSPRSVSTPAYACRVLVAVYTLEDILPAAAGVSAGADSWV